MNTAQIQDKDYNLKYEDIFDGPIFLLVELVQKKKIDIYDISLSYVINGFVEFIKENSEVLLDTISSFVYFSSILLEVKSRSLLPSKKEPEEGEGELGINILRRREEEYRIYKKVSNYISSKILEESLFYIREAPMEKEFLETLPDFTKKLNWDNYGRLLAGCLQKRSLNWILMISIITAPRSIFLKKWEE